MKTLRSIPASLGKGRTAAPSHQDRGCRSAVAPGVGQVCLLVVVCVLLSSHPPADAADRGPAQDRRAVVFGPPKELAQLAVTKDCRSVTSEPAKVRTTTLTFSVNLSGCFIYPAPEGFDYLAVEDLEPFTQPAEPQLPMKTFIVRLDRNAEVYGVEVVGGTYREVQQPVYIVPVPWLGFTDDGKYIPNAALYRTNGFFPGSLVAYDRGNDSRWQHVFVRFFPLQYIPGQSKAMVVTQARLKLYYGKRASGNQTKPPQPQPSFVRKMTGDDAIMAAKAECLIICPLALQEEARKLSDFHTSKEGIRTSVVTTEALAAAYEPVEDPPFNGYRNRQLKGWNTITNYHYALAKQITAYLRDEEMHPRLRYVTILGDGLLVPPSYYYYFGEIANSHTSWVPTDFFYGSPDYDFVPNHAVGRLSVNDAAEAARLVDKIIRWHANAQWEWFRNVWLAGGRLYDYMPYTGEMAFQEAIEEGLFSGMRVKKYYQSDDRLDRAHLLPAFTTASVGTVIYKGHGTVFGPLLSSGAMGANDLLNCAPNDRIPIVWSESCYSGAYDLDLMNPGGFPCSFGEAVLKSPAGGIAFFGASRLSSGWPLYYYQRGEPRVTKLTEMAGMVHFALRSYHQGADTLGQLYSDALYFHVSNNKMAGHTVNTQSIFPFVLLGDPALKIPKRM